MEQGSELEKQVDFEEQQTNPDIEQSTDLEKRIRAKKLDLQKDLEMWPEGRYLLQDFVSNVYAQTLIATLRNLRII